MRSLTLDEMLGVTATDFNLFKQLRNRKQLALGFGRSDAYASLRYVELDGVALLLTDTLAKSHGRVFAAQAVRIYWDVWGYVVAQAEAEPEQAANFCVLDLAQADGKAAHMMCGATGSISDEAIALQLAATPQAAGAEAERITCINLSRLIRFMRQTAGDCGVDLSGVFLPPPDDPRTVALLDPWEKARAHAVDALGAMRAKDEQAAKRQGLLARTAIEAYLPVPEGALLQ